MCLRNLINIFVAKGKLQICGMLSFLLRVHNYVFGIILLKHYPNSQINNVLPRPKNNLSCA